MKREIFNEEALARLRSPERLDALFRVTQPASWMALLMVGLLCASIVLWGVYGVISESVNVVGMIVDTGGLVNVYHEASGQLSEVLVRPGSRVKKGEVVARLSDLTLANELAAAKKKVQAASNKQEAEVGISNYDVTLSKLFEDTEIVSAYDGIVSEVAVNQGDVVTAGSTVICSIRLTQGREEVTTFMYAPIESAKRIRPGMVAHLTPSGVDAQIDGSLMGVVREVSLYPVTSSGILKNLGNSEVVSWILNKLGGAAVEVKVDLVKDPKADSVYLWTSIVGDHPPVTAGSACSGSIVVDRKPPLAKIFLKLSHWLRNT
jgi:multidrug efflux pump subunit AcrA (membrane-fusion protein)